MPSHEESPPPAPPDARLYVPEHEGCDARIKRDWEQDYCFAKAPGQDYFHLLLAGEIYLERGDEKYCLNCALRLGFITRERLYWQRGGAAASPAEHRG